MKLKVKKIVPDAQLPVYATPGAACFDIHAYGGDWNINSQAYGVDVSENRSALFRTGLAFEIPPGHVMLVFSRSGHGLKNDVRLANCVGVIDSDYRGELMVKLTADSSLGRLTVRAGDRIAQAMIVPVNQVEFELAEELSKTERGAGGFGSTGA